MTRPGLLTEEKEDLKDFWSRYLDYFEMINDSRLYRDFLRAGIRSLEIRPGAKILDAGCGFAYWSFSLIDWLSRNDPQALGTISITAFDYVEKVLRTAQEKFSFISAERLKQRSPQFRVVLGDANTELKALEDRYYDIIGANLLLPYVKDPLASLKKMAEKLKPGGQIVVTSLIPNPRLIIVVLAYVWERLWSKKGWGEIKHNLPKGWQLYKEANKIKELTKSGVFKYFSKPELKELLSSAGLERVTVRSALAGQGLIAIGQKPEH